MSILSDESLKLVIVDKVVLALIVGGGLTYFSMILDSKIERLRSELEIQRIVFERQLNSSARVWTAGYELGMIIKSRLEGTSSNEDILRQRTKLENILKEEGRFLGVKEVDNARIDLIVNLDVEKINELIDKLNNGDKSATKELQMYWNNYAENVWFPFLERFEETGGSLICKD